MTEHDRTGGRMKMRMQWHDITCYVRYGYATLCRFYSMQHARPSVRLDFRSDLKAIAVFVFFSITITRTSRVTNVDGAGSTWYIIYIHT